MKLMKFQKRKKNGFTLMETIVTLVIYSFILLMVTNVVLINAKLNEQLKMRSRIRSELAEMSALIKRDLRNASSINITECTLTKCPMSVGGQTILWSLKDNKIQKTINSEGIFTSSDLLVIKKFDFTVIAKQDSPGDTQLTIILTINVDGKNENWKVNNQLVQEVISTRNYQVVQ
jgi:prepilin-type N-terminal cleavage/methylation domain-containing protein